MLVLYCLLSLQSNVDQFSSIQDAIVFSDCSRNHVKRTKYLKQFYQMAFFFYYFCKGISTFLCNYMCQWVIAWIFYLHHIITSGAHVTEWWQKKNILKSKYPLLSRCSQIVKNRPGTTTTRGGSGGWGWANCRFCQHSRSSPTPSRSDIRQRMTTISWTNILLLWDIKK